MKTKRRAPVLVRGIPLAKIIDRAALVGIGLGFVLIFQPWGNALRLGFFVSLVSTITHVVTSHLDTAGVRAEDGRELEQK